MMKRDSQTVERLKVVGVGGGGLIGGKVVKLWRDQGHEAARGDRRRRRGLFGTPVTDRSLTPDAPARFGELRFAGWLAASGRRG